MTEQGRKEESVGNRMAQNSSSRCLRPCLECKDSAETRHLVNRQREKKKKIRTSITQAAKTQTGMWGDWRKKYVTEDHMTSGQDHLSSRIIWHYANKVSGWRCLLLPPEAPRWQVEKKKKGNKHLGSFFPGLCDDSRA